VISNIARSAGERAWENKTATICHDTPVETVNALLDEAEVLASEVRQATEKELIERLRRLAMKE
jgi:hypothetical protein